MELTEYLVEQTSKVARGARYMLGIAGAPGAGKSTVAEWLRWRVNAVLADAAIVVPMDGFHRQNIDLDLMGLRQLKGIPQTFDGAGFVHTLEQLRALPASKVDCPAFKRALDEPQPGAIVVEPHHRLIIVEGNYLLLKEEPWHRVSELLDEVWYIESLSDDIMPRLLQRHIQGGRSPEAARLKVESTDLPNARLIEATRGFADRVITAKDLDDLRVDSPPENQHQSGVGPVPT